MANHVIIQEPYWNPFIEAQAIDRAHRIGQTKEVHVHRLLVKDTVEDRIIALQTEKKKMVGVALGTYDEGDEEEGYSSKKQNTGMGVSGSDLMGLLGRNTKSNDGVPMAYTIFFYKPYDSLSSQDEEEDDEDEYDEDEDDEEEKEDDEDNEEEDDDDDEEEASNWIDFAKISAAALNPDRTSPSFAFAGPSYGSSSHPSTRGPSSMQPTNGYTRPQTRTPLPTSRKRPSAPKKTRTTLANTFPSLNAMLPNSSTRERAAPEDDTVAASASSLQRPPVQRPASLSSSSSANPSSSRALHAPLPNLLTRKRAAPEDDTVAKQPSAPKQPRATAANTPGFRATLPNLLTRKRSAARGRYRC